MDHIVTLDSRQEAALQAVADKFVAVHRGDVMKALKEMMVLNGRLQDQLDARSMPRRASRKEGNAMAHTMRVEAVAHSGNSSKAN
ncbi:MULTISPECIES: hypothetical protein [Mesorhizobium]|uniref:hypothetical protein n=1 Tax=Mesorhizobium TaxID=68287 RepID=UPI0013E0D3E0|nr:MULTISPECIES: hypothetical protein [Mesorhizobium]MCF6127326.1 hypothetical protein [Mesorhizobium ciceri]MCQ8817449.1 hypothetical protein [Mesorhizobium sp. SEMIA396]